MDQQTNHYHPNYSKIKTNKHFDFCYHCTFLRVERKKGRWSDEEVGRGDADVANGSQHFGAHPFVTEVSGKGCDQGVHTPTYDKHGAHQHGAETKLKLKFQFKFS